MNKTSTAVQSKNKERAYEDNGLLVLIVVIFVYSTAILLSNHIVYAEKLTDLFQTEAFKGSLAVIENNTLFNYLGIALNFIISAFSFIGLFLIVEQRVVTLLYLSSKAKWDHIHELKNAGKGQKFLGLPAIFKDNITTANHGTGLDALLNFAASFLPDVREASDYADDAKGQYGLQDTDSTGTYIMRVSIPTILSIFFFSMGFSGSLFQAYGSIVDAMMKVSDSFVELHLDQYVERLITKGSAYKFSYDADGTDLGKLKQGIAEKVYAETIKKIENPTTSVNQQVGAKVDQVMKSKLFGENNSTGVASDAFRDAVNRCITDAPNMWDGTETTAGNVNYSVTVNGNPEPYSEGDTVISMGELVDGLGVTIKTPTDDKSTYYCIHIQFSMDKAMYNIFTTNSGGKSNNQGGNGSSGDNTGNAAQAPTDVH